VDFDFAAILVGLTALTGGIWLLDHLFFAKSRAGRDALLANEKKEPLLDEYARSFFPVILIVLLVRSFLAEPFRIPSSSMMPTLLIGDFMLVN
jgi:signal peptidase I